VLYDNAQMVSPGEKGLAGLLHLSATSSQDAKKDMSSFRPVQSSRHRVLLDGGLGAQEDTSTSL
jgi:hypothetical protein